MLRLTSLVALAACCPPTPAPKIAAPVIPAVVPPAAPPPLALDTLEQGKPTHGFTPTALYLDGADRPIGARLVHVATGFQLDYLRIESAPQGFLWVNTFPTSDKGEPHTQEHLLLGKGDRGRKLASMEAMALAESSAFTDPLKTCYHFHTVAGPDVFWPVFQDQLDALLNPDYTDEEIRREVRNFGVDKADDGKLRLEEKGTVYNEMVRTYESPDQLVGRAASQLIYGAHHPLAYEAGGYPEAIRTMTPSDIRTFHDHAYHLANMGMIGAFPAAMSLEVVLDRTAALLDQEAGRKGVAALEADLPKPAPAAPGSIEVVEYPYADPTNPGPMLLAWPATRDLAAADRLVLALFLDAFAGDASTTLYGKLIDGKTRVIDLGASGVAGSATNDLGEPVYLSIAGVRADRLDARTIGEVRDLVHAELEWIAKLPDGDPELVAFDQRVRSRATDLRRRLGKLLDTPPRFGTRGIGAEWFGHLRELQREPGFRKSLVEKPELAAVERLLAGTANPWRDRLSVWGLLGQPFGVAARPSPTLRARLDAERTQRIADEQARLGQQYGTTDPAVTLARYQTDYDAQSKLIEAASQATVLPPLVDSLPMTRDDGLAFTTEPIGGVTAFRATIDSMVSTRVSLAFDVTGVADDDLMYLALLPGLLSGVGVIEDGKPVGSAEMRERLRKEILELSVGYDHNRRTGRAELVVSGAGSDPAETRLALGWMARAMLAPDWRLDNLPRLCDVIDQAITGMRQAMLGAEEDWVRDPHDAWWRQAWPVFLHTRSFLTQLHDLHRLRWMLLDPGQPASVELVARLLETLADAKLPRKGLAALAAALADPRSDPKGRYTTAAVKGSARALVAEAGKDLQAALAELPDGSLAKDWRYLCLEMRADLMTGAPRALARLAAVRKLVVDAATARVIEVGSAANLAALAPEVAALVGRLVRTPRPAITHASGDAITQRMLDHDPAAAQARFVGLVDPATSSGVFLNSAPSTGETDVRDDAVLDYLASNLYTGHGAHSMFMKTWAAGLAYSNGLHPLLAQGQLEYYAERCPLLPQTLRFVIEQLRAARPDASLARYAVATAFSSRIAGSYESRAAEMAADLVDGVGPTVTRAFRGRILELARRGELATTLFARMPAVYSRVLPGLGPISPDAVNFVIGPDKQLGAYQDYLHAAVDKATTLHRLYPRDFWIPAKL